MIQELTQRGICVSLGKGWGRRGSVSLCHTRHAAAFWGCSINNGVSVRLDGVGLSFAWPACR